MVLHHWVDIISASDDIPPQPLSEPLESPLSAQIIPVQPFDLVVFGGTGDLALRKLLPALYHRDADGQLPEDARVIAVSRQALDDDSYRASDRGECDGGSCCWYQIIDA